MKLSYITTEENGLLSIKFSGAFPQKLRNKLKSIGFVYSRSTLCWSGRKHHEEAVKIAEEICSCDYDDPEYNAKYKDTLCWACKNSILGSFSPCPWARKFEPVENWYAVPIYDRKTGSALVKNPGEPQSYCVISCPMFDPD